MPAGGVQATLRHPEQTRRFHPPIPQYNRSMEEDPQICSICQQPLRRMKHPTAHEQAFHWDVEIRTCPHNLHSAHRYDEPRHDEWHRGEHGWMRREL